MILGFSPNKGFAKLINSPQVFSTSISTSTPSQANISPASSEETPANFTPIYKTSFYYPFLGLCTVLSLCGVFCLAFFHYRDQQYNTVRV